HEMKSRLLDSKYISLAQHHPGTRVAAYALSYLACHRGFSPAGTTAMKEFTRSYAAFNDPKLELTCRMPYINNPEYVAMMKALRDRSPSTSIHALATLRVAEAAKKTDKKEALSLYHEVLANYASLPYSPEHKVSFGPAAKAHFV